MPTSKPSRSPRATASQPSPKRSSRKTPAPARPLHKAAPVSRKSLPSASKPTAPPTTGTKQSRLIALLRSDSGATVTQMTDLTGWQPHTVRGTISGVLRKKLGLVVSCTPADSGMRIYRIVEAA